MKSLIASCICLLTVCFASVANADTDLKRTLGPSISSAVKSATSSKYREHVTVNHLSLSNSGVLKGKITVQYAKYVKAFGHKKKIWSVRYVIHLQTKVTNPVQSQIRLDVGNLRGLVKVNVGAVQKTLLRWISSRKSELMRYVRTPRSIKMPFTIVNRTKDTVRFRLPDGKTDYLIPNAKGSYTFDLGAKKPQLLLVFNSGKSYRITGGAHMFFWMKNENRVGFDMNYKRK